jgi:hypothetical protein
LTTNFFSPLSFVAVFGSGIRDPEWVKIRIRDKHRGSATLLESYPAPLFQSSIFLLFFNRFYERQEMEDLLPEQDWECRSGLQLAAERAARRSALKACILHSQI